MAKNKVKWKIEIIVLECLLIVALLAIVFVKKVESYTFDSEATYFTDANSYIINAKSTAKVDSETQEITIDRKDDLELDASAYPVYYNNAQKMVLMKDYLYLDMSEGKVRQLRLSYFTEISKQDNTYIIERDSFSNTELGGILYDGEGLYVFLEPVIITYGNIRVSLPEFSFAYIEKNNFIRYYNYDTGNEGMEFTSELISLTDKSNSYTINLSSDIIHYNTDYVMLDSFVDNYEPYFEETEE